MNKASFSYTCNNTFRDDECAKTKGKEDDVVLQQNEAYCTHQVQLQQSECDHSSCVENKHQQLLQ